MNCPRCNISLKTELYESVEIDRCPECKGTWLDANEITKISTIRNKKFTSDLVHRTLSGETSHVSLQDKTILCPKCSEPLTTVNYDYSSGIIIDSCHNSHGIWLDYEELEKVQIHNEKWEDTLDEKQDEWTAYLNSSEADFGSTRDKERKAKMRITKYFADSIIRTILKSF